MGLGHEQRDEKFLTWHLQGTAHLQSLSLEPGMGNALCLFP